MTRLITQPMTQILDRWIPKSNAPESATSPLILLHFHADLIPSEQPRTPASLLPHRPDLIPSLATPLPPLSATPPPPLPSLFALSASLRLRLPRPPPPSAAVPIATSGC